MKRRMFTSLISLRDTSLVFIMKLTEMEVNQEAVRRPSTGEGMHFVDEIEMQP